MMREQKEAFIDDMRRDMERAAGVLFVDYTGLKVQDVDTLRRKYRAAGVRYKVVKNTLMARVLKGLPAESAISMLKGTPTGVVIGFDDPVTVAKLTFDFMKDNDRVKVKGAIVDQQAINAKQAEALSKMPSKAEIQASVIGQVMSPGRMLLAQVKSPAGRVVGAIEKLIENKEKEGQ